LIWLGFRRKSIPYIRERRVAGKSSWTFRKKWAYMLNSIFSFTALPIALLGLVGWVGIIASCVLAVIVLLYWYMGHIEVSGYTPLMLVLLFSSSAHLIGLSVVGSYVWRTYENSKRRPQSVLLHQLSFPNSSPKGGTVETVHSLKRDL
jgi:polyisoprenyl-phosphate glycosyltransferase